MKEQLKREESWSRRIEKTKLMLKTGFQGQVALYFCTNNESVDLSVILGSSFDLGDGFCIWHPFDFLPNANMKWNPDTLKLGVKTQVLTR